MEKKRTMIQINKIQRELMDRRSSAPFNNKMVKRMKMNMIRMRMTTKKMMMTMLFDNNNYRLNIFIYFFMFNKIKKMNIA